MTDQEQRIAIAKWMGWQESVERRGRITQGDVTVWRLNGLEGELPNYTHDLNAMHEAEAKLTNAQRRRYASMLVDVHPLHYDPRGANGDDKSMNLFLIAMMTAAQRAEALLRTLGLWKEKDVPRSGPKN